MVINPFDFFIEEYAERFPFEYEPTLEADLAPYLRPVDDSDAGRRPGSDGAARRCPTAACRPCSSSPASTPPSTATSPTTCGWSRASRRPTRRCARRDRLVPRQRVAAGQPAAPVRPRRPLRLGLPRAARRRPDRRSTGRAAPSAGLHRPARLGRGVHPRRRLGRAGPDERAVRRRGAHPAERDAAPEQRRADRGRDRAGRGDLRLPQRGAPRPRGPADTKPYTDAAVGAHRRARRGGRRAAATRATCA